MRESVIYQDILQQGESGIILKQLKHKFGVVPLELQAKIQQLSTTQLEALGEALLDFTSPEDLSSWLEQNYRPFKRAIASSIASNLSRRQIASLACK